ncbi:MarR family transcriptional regulator [Agromyces atrinae]|uniref:MarR family winged helix-turn-helix transcriptional regulator n=1 Tax=Agromyces atrinae TaxID=592376 RepID=UPI001F594770|nr:MarR family transcriptional regulator [Agromyces atrinae]MCI2956440.1 MarR family transcriptional regulator [Agromyces atrinae]
MAHSQRRSMPTEAELRIWRDYIETAEVLRTELTRRLQSDSGVSAANYPVLLALSEAEGRSLRSSALADVMGWERSRLSHQLGRMEKHGLIRRDICADDSRGAEITLTAEGASAFRASSVPHLRAIRELFVDAFDSTQLAQIGEISTRLRAHLDA